MADKLVEMVRYMKTPRVNLIRHDFENAYNLTAQFPMWWTDEDMNEVAAPLFDEIGGSRGLGYTCRFRWQDYDRVKEFYKGLGYEIHDVDERERDRKMKVLIYGE